MVGSQLAAGSDPLVEHFYQESKSEHMQGIEFVVQNSKDRHGRKFSKQGVELEEKEVVERA